MLARRGVQILAFTKRDAVRLGLISTLLVAGLTLVLAFDDLTTMTEISDVVAVFGWLLLSIVVVTTLHGVAVAFPLAVVAPQQRHPAGLARVADRNGPPGSDGRPRRGALPGAHSCRGAAAGGPARCRVGQRGHRHGGVLAGVVTGSMDLAAYTFLGGIVGTIVIGRGERLSQFAQAGASIAVTNVAVVLAFTIIVGSENMEMTLQLLGAALISAFGASIAAAGTFALLGSVFGITTSYQLLELANPTQPLLRRLLLEAPGTYHHSLMVGNLAEQAAEAIGADALVTRVAAYYHDVGKLYDPLVFIENQGGGDNIHDQLAPEESAAMVMGHVARGIDIAYQYKLPKAIIPYIPQHHGTALMGYFYAKARQIAAEEAGAPAGSKAANEAGDKVDQRRFRHAGPKPQTREAAILMLADSVEASVRSLSSHEEPAIRAMVSRIISDRLIDGQFDECDLTLRDLDRTRESFIEQLLAMYHRRIAYPTNKIVELESRRPLEKKGA